MLRTSRYTCALSLAGLASLSFVLGGCPDNAAKNGTSGSGQHGSSSSGSAGSNGSMSSTGSGSPSSGSSASSCHDDSTVILASSLQRLVGDMAVDDSAIYYSQGSGARDQNGIFRLPKAGGEPKRIGEMDNLIDGGPIFLDGDYVYYGDSNLNRVKKDGGGDEILFKATSGVSEVVGDKDAIYFRHGAWCCDSLGTDTTQHLMRMDKQSLQVSEVASAADMESLVVDGDFVYWIGSIDKQTAMGALSEKPNDLMRTQISTGKSTVLFEAPKDLSGLNPGSAFGSSIVVTDSEVIFGSLSLKKSSKGIYRIAKTAEKGTPSALTTDYTFSSAFLAGDAVYTSDGEAIERIALADGAKTQVACGDPGSPTHLMAHDADHVYFARFTNSGDGGIGEELRSTPLK